MIADTFCVSKRR